MAKKFRELRARLSPEAQARAALRTQELLAEATLAEIRALRDVTQARLAEILQISQGAVSRIEGREDTYISTVRSYVEAMGGTLELVAKFNDTVIKVVSLSDRQRINPSPAVYPNIWSAEYTPHHGNVSLLLDNATIKAGSSAVIQEGYTAFSKLLKEHVAPRAHAWRRSRTVARTKGAGTNVTKLRVSI